MLQHFCRLRRVLQPRQALLFDAFVIELFHVRQERCPAEAADAREQDAIAIGHKGKVDRRYNWPEANGHLQQFGGRGGFDEPFFPTGHDDRGAFASYLVCGQEFAGHLAARFRHVQRFHVRHAKKEANRGRGSVCQLLDGGFGNGSAKRDRGPDETGKAHPCVQRGRHEEAAVRTEAGAFGPIVFFCKARCTEMCGEVSGWERCKTEFGGIVPCLLTN